MPSNGFRFDRFVDMKLESNKLLRQHSISRARKLTSNGSFWINFFFSTVIRKLDSVGHGTARDEASMEGALFIQRSVNGMKWRITDYLNFAKELEKRDR